MGTATCDLEKISISLDTKDKLVTEILKEIEKQAKYTFEILGDNALTIKKSIKLDQTPLDLTLNRLLTGLNYSIICNNDKKIIMLVLLDKNGSPSSTPTPKNTNGAPTNGMEGLSKAMDAYHSNKRAAVDPNQQEPEEMKGLSSALQDYTNNKANKTIPTSPPHEKTEMDAATEALKQHKANEQSPDAIPLAENTGSGEMVGLASAMKEYHNTAPSKSAAPPVTQQATPTTMDGATTAMEEYRKLHTNR